MEEHEERQWAMLCHLGAYAGFLFPLANIVVPVVLWQLRRERSAFVDEQGKEAVNFQLSLVAAVVGGVVLLLFAQFAGVAAALFTALLLPAALVYWFVAVLFAAVRANAGTAWRYPLSLRFIR